MRPFRICIVAEHASMRFGGEAILPVHYFRLLRSRGIDVRMVVHSRTRDELEELFPEDLDRICFVPDLWIHKLFFALSRYLPRRLSEATFGLLNQLITQLYQRAIVIQLVREYQIDVVHQPIPVSPRFPSAMFNVGAAVVIGPMNGGMEYPPAFASTESILSRGAIAIARMFTDLANVFLPGKKRASVLLVANERTRSALPSGSRGNVRMLVENGIDVDVWRSSAEGAGASTSRFIFIGRLVDWKAVDIVIRALAHVPGAELEIVGDGSMRGAWESLVSEVGVRERVHFAGWLTQQECVVRLRSAIALVLPSVYECGGAVVLEAMASGKPVIATDWGGPADYLNPECGILVRPESREALVFGFAAAMQRLMNNPDLARSMGHAGRERATRIFNWQGKVEQMLQIYSEAAEKRDDMQEAMENRVSPGAVSGQERV